MSYQTKRDVDGYIELPVETFRHPDTESSISLVGMVHTAKPCFYQSVGEYVQIREESGSTVHYERSTLPSKQELETYPHWVQKLAPKFDKAVSALTKATIKDGVVSQYNNDKLRFKDVWEIHDMNKADIARSLGPAKTMYAAVMLEREAAIENGDKKDRLPFYAMRAKLVLRMLDTVILDERNAVAVKGIEMTLIEKPDQDITLLWGSCHIPGIANGITKIGYKHKDTIWLNTGKYTE